MFEFHKCMAYLKKMGVRTMVGMEPKHAAWMIGDAAFTSTELDAMGAKDLPWSKWGDLLPKMEEGLSKRRGRRSAPEMTAQRWNKLVGMMACYGLKGSAIRSEADAVAIARFLWGSQIKKSDTTAQAVLVRLESMQKKHRSYVARSNLRKVPAKYF